MTFTGKHAPGMQSHDASTEHAHARHVPCHFMLQYMLEAFCGQRHAMAAGFPRKRASGPA